MPVLLPDDGAVSLRAGIGGAIRLGACERPYAEDPYPFLDYAVEIRGGGVQASVLVRSLAGDDLPGFLRDLAAAPRSLSIRDAIAAALPSPRRLRSVPAPPPSSEPVPLRSSRTVVGPRHTCRAVLRGRGLTRGDLWLSDTSSSSTASATPSRWRASGPRPWATCWSRRRPALSPGTTGGTTSGCPSPGSAGARTASSILMAPDLASGSRWCPTARPSATASTSTSTPAAGGTSRSRPTRSAWTPRPGGCATSAPRCSAT